MPSLSLANSANARDAPLHFECGPSNFCTSNRCHDHTKCSPALPSPRAIRAALCGPRCAYAGEVMQVRPVILIVDDEARAVAELLDALARRFGADYRVIPHLSARAALDDIARMKADGEELALVIADQWMP